MMYGNGFGFGMHGWGGAWLPVHGLFVLAGIVGFIFFMAWALKNLKKDQLRNWGIGLFVVGLIGGLVTCFMFGFGKFGKFGGPVGFEMKGGYEQCLQDEGCAGHMNGLKSWAENYAKGEK